VADILKKEQETDCITTTRICHEKVVNFEYKNTYVFKVILTIHHHHVPEGLGVFPVP